jgi:L-fucose isomerase-like protein
MLPAFLPFPVGPDGSQRVVPVACEGDLNGLVSLLILHAVNPDVPPLFGDFVEYKKDYVLLRNCGSSSVYWAGASADPAVSFPRTDFLSNIHGKTGAAVHYETPAIDTITACRLFRLRDKFHLIVLPGRVLAENDSSAYKDPWPHTRVKFGVDPDVLFQVYPCNHSSLTRGDFTREIEWIGRFANIPVHVLRSTDDAERLLSLI